MSELKLRSRLSDANRSALGSCYIRMLAERSHRVC